MKSFMEKHFCLNCEKRCKSKFDIILKEKFENIFKLCNGDLYKFVFCFCFFFFAYNYIDLFQKNFKTLYCQSFSSNLNFDIVSKSDYNGPNAFERKTWETAIAFTYRTIPFYCVIFSKILKNIYLKFCNFDLTCLNSATGSS